MRTSSARGLLGESSGRPLGRSEPAPRDQSKKAPTLAPRPPPPSLPPPPPPPVSPPVTQKLPPSLRQNNLIFAPLSNNCPTLSVPSPSCVLCNAHPCLVSAGVSVPPVSLPLDNQTIILRDTQAQRLDVVTVLLEDRERWWDWGVILAKGGEQGGVPGIDHNTPTVRTKVKSPDSLGCWARRGEGRPRASESRCLFWPPHPSPLLLTYCHGSRHYLQRPSDVSLDTARRTPWTRPMIIIKPTP